MDSIQTRILAGEIVLTKTDSGYAVSGLADKLESASYVTGRKMLADTAVASKKDGSTVKVILRGLIGRTVVEGQEVIKAHAEFMPEPTFTYRAPRPVNGICRCDGEADNRGRCYQCGGYQRHADAGRYL